MNSSYALFLICQQIPKTPFHRRSNFEKENKCLPSSIKIYLNSCIIHKANGVFEVIEMCAVSFFDSVARSRQKKWPFILCFCIFGISANEFPFFPVHSMDKNVFITQSSRIAEKSLVITIITMWHQPFRDYSFQTASAQNIGRSD